MSTKMLAYVAGLVLLCMVLSPAVAADDEGIDISTTSWSSGNTVSEGYLLTLQNSTDSAQPINFEEAIFQGKLTVLDDHKQTAWNMILSLFKVTLDMLLILFYVLELRLFIFVVIELMPSMFTKLVKKVSEAVI